MRSIILSGCLAFAFACSNDPGPNPNPTPSPVPALSPGGGTDLTATARQALVCNSGDLAWSIQEGAVGGTITSGIYTAPSCGPAFIAGTYHVLVTGCGRGATIPIDVTERILTVELVCAIPEGTSICQDPALGVEVEVGHTAQFYSKVTASCATVFVPPIPAGACQAPFCE